MTGTELAKLEPLVDASPRVTKKALHLEGTSYGGLKVLCRDLDNLGKNNSWWIVECLHCGQRFSSEAPRIKANKHGCKSCSVKNRVYKILSTNCQVCGKELETESRHPNRYCSAACRTTAAVGRSTSERRSSVEGTIKQLTTACKSRAKRKGMEFDIDFPFMMSLLDRQNGRCAKTGRLLEASAKDSTGLRGTSPGVASVDRISSLKGYTKDNVQLVCYMYNVAKNKYGELDLIELCTDVLNNAGYDVSARRAEVHE